MSYAILLAVGIVTLLLFAEALLSSGEITFRRACIASAAWFTLGLGPAVAIGLTGSAGDGTSYLSVYLIERVLTLDNLIVFLMIFSWFAVPVDARNRLLPIGIGGALVLRGIAIVAGLALIARLHFVTYLLGLLLLFLAWRMWSGATEHADLEANPAVRVVRRLMPVTGYDGTRFTSVRDGRRAATPMLLALAAMVAADLAFAIDSIPAALAITDNALVIWTANGFALLGLRPLFVLVEELVRRFRYLDKTVALVLGVVAVKLLLADVWKVPPLLSLGVILVMFAAGMSASIWADRRASRTVSP